MLFRHAKELRDGYEAYATRSFSAPKLSPCCSRLVYLGSPPLLPNRGRVFSLNHELTNGQLGLRTSPSLRKDLFSSRLLPPKSCSARRLGDGRGRVHEALEGHVPGPLNEKKERVFFLRMSQVRPLNEKTSNNNQRPPGPISFFQWQEWPAADRFNTHGSRRPFQRCDSCPAAC